MPNEDQSFNGSCPTCGQSCLETHLHKIATKIAEMTDEASAILKGPRFMFVEYIQEIEKIIRKEMQ